MTFTGIVEELGEVVAAEPRGDGARLGVRAGALAIGLRPGDSVAVNGVCLTVTDVQEGAFRVDVMRETLSRTDLGGLRPRSRVNLERPVALGGRLGGHLVQGHVDGTGEIVERVSGDGWETVRMTVPAGLARYVVPKGSVAVDGVSLTVVQVDHGTFSVGLIPETLRRTTLGHKRQGDTVNLEVDVIAKYVESLMRAMEGHR